MPKYNDGSWLGFLTDKRKQMFLAAMEASNQHHQAILASSAHIYEHMSERDRAFDTRSWGIGHLMETFSNEEGAMRREVKNIIGIEFDRQYFVYFKKIEDPNEPIPEAKTIENAKALAGQLAFQDMLDDTPTQEIPLCELQLVLAGYTRADGIITAIYFMDQWEGEIRNQYKLENPYSTVRESQEIKLPPKTQFALKRRKA